MRIYFYTILHSLPDPAGNAITRPWKALPASNEGRPMRYTPLPANGQDEPEVGYQQAVLKRHLHIRPAWQIGENDHDIVVLDDDEDPFIPDGVDDAPVLKALAARRARKRGWGAR